MNQLGDIVCTTPQCDAGAAAVNAMDSFYQSLDPGTQASYKQQHDSIMTAFNSAYSWYSSYIPFNPTCCTVQQIGQQADALLCTMQGGTGCVPLASGSGGMSLTSMIVIGAVAYLGFVYLASRR